MKFGVNPSVLCTRSGGKVWRGAWLLWKSLLHFEGALPSGRRVLEVGAGVGLVGLLLAADHGMKAWVGCFGARTAEAVRRKSAVFSDDHCIYQGLAQFC